MESEPNRNVYTPHPPPRQLTPKIHLSKDHDEEGQPSDRYRLLVNCSQLTDVQMILLKEVLQDLPAIMHDVAQRQTSQLRARMVETFTRPASIIEQYRGQARQLEAWKRSLLASMPCVPLEEAERRCEGTPWDATSDLLWLAHHGRRYFPQCQFTVAGAPDPAWVALVDKANSMSDCREWDLVAWVLTPHPLLDGKTPMDSLSSDPRHVSSLVNSHRGDPEPLIVFSDPMGTETANPVFSAHITGMEATCEHYPATVTAEFHQIDQSVTEPWLESLFQLLPTLLPALTGSDRLVRLTHLAELTYLGDWKVERDIEHSIAGHAVTADIFRTIPLLTAQEVEEQMASLDQHQWSQMMKLPYGGQSYYFAEQFAEDGTPHPVCQQIMKLFRANPTLTDWKVAIWWMTSTDLLSGASPRQRFVENPDAVIHAARQEVLKDE